MPDEASQKALNCMANAAQTVREAISVSMPVAPTQLMTMQIPGLNIDHKKYLYDQVKNPFPPLAVQINEAQLVDNMVPVAKMMMGRTGKSVARSYMAALDLLMPVEASVSGAVALNKKEAVEPRLKGIRDRYETSMTFLTSADVHNAPSTKITTYVAKQAQWNKAIEGYAIAQERQLAIANAEGKDTEAKRQIYLEWLQAHGRDYKAAIQARYMDWVVHGYKFEVEFNFSVVDISSGMKRVEASKEAFRNLSLIDADGASEYYRVKLEPSDWAERIKEVYDNWGKGDKGRSAFDIRSEIKRLKKLLMSHEVMQKSVKDGDFIPLGEPVDAAADDQLKAAYKGAYKAINDLNQERDAAKDGSGTAKVSSSGEQNGQVNGEPNKNSQPETRAAPAAATTTAPTSAPTPIKLAADKKFEELRDAQQKWTESSLESNKKANRDNGKVIMEKTENYLNARLAEMKEEIKSLESELVATGSDRANIIGVIDANGQTVEPSELKASKPEDSNSTAKPSSWTRITAKVSSSKSADEKVTESSASSFAVKAGWGLWSASGGASHTSASSKAMSSMSSLDVEIGFDAMLVEINRPWLHAELFSDHELDCAEGFDLSPGPEALHGMVAQNKPVKPEHTEFCSYPTAFVVAANVELEFSGNTSSLEAALESSSTEANVRVGYGPFALSASHKQSRSKASTKAESTATGMRISLQAPQIISWVSELLPQLPKPQNASKMYGLSLQEKQL